MMKCAETNIHQKMLLSNNKVLAEASKDQQKQNTMYNTCNFDITCNGYHFIWNGCQQIHKTSLILMQGGQIY